MGKGLALAALGEHGEPFLERVGGGGMHFYACVAALEIFERMRVGVVFSLIDLACCHAVTKHLLDVADRHRDRLIELGFGVEIVPILKMMAISALVVEPCGGISEQLALALIWAACTLVIACARQKLGGRILGKIVKKPLPADARAEAMRNDTVAVLGNGVKMTEWMGHKQNPFQLRFLYYSTLRGKSQFVGNIILKMFFM